MTRRDTESKKFLEITVDRLRNVVAQIGASAVLRINLRKPMPLKATFRFRTSHGVLQRANRVRKANGQTKSQFGRNALLNYVEEKERELGLPPLNRRPLNGLKKEAA